MELLNLYGIASGLSYSASLGISHSDLKPANFLMSDNPYPKITDFDSARLEIEEKKQSFNVSSNEISSPIYMSPESINDEITSIEKADVYSYSMIAYQVITGKTPFDESI